MAETDVIRTPDQRLRVFVSSTLQEMAAERQAVRDAVTRLRLVPVMFELAARRHPPRQVYRAYLAQSQVFVGVYWQSCGWPRCWTGSRTRRASPTSIFPMPPNCRAWSRTIWRCF